jgi:aspartyl-tRNA(Asn)/glutamyl-tRNA(Gln) amidotransferase subunit C
MKINIDVIDRVSTLARLRLSQEEKEEFMRQLNDIVQYVEKINELDTGNVKPADHIVDLSNVYRKDEVAPSIDRNDIEKIAPDFGNGHFIVPRIIEEV